MLTARSPAPVTAYVNGWRQYDDGSWFRAGTEHDAFTCHHDDDGDELPFGVVVARSAEEAVRIDRETFGRGVRS